MRKKNEDDEGIEYAVRRQTIYNGSACVIHEDGIKEAGTSIGQRACRFFGEGNSTFLTVCQVFIDFWEFFSNILTLVYI